ncbi:hypothetical protein [Allocoleopsis franciscana]|uniref:hypothetical protein n=1 Tax=Allocoleopsis franciscana TaxID=2886352 RepID=UPI00031C79F0|nr:hypothetical protein [Allocoleopsis franciscana]
MLLQQATLKLLEAVLDFFGRFAGEDARGVFAAKVAEERFGGGARYFRTGKRPSGVVQ